MDLDWRTVVLLLACMPALAAAIWNVALSRENRSAWFFLSLIFAWVLLATPYTIGFSGAYQAFPGLTFFPFNTELWLGPIWLLLVMSFTQVRLSARWWTWLLPGILQTTYYTICFLSLGSAENKFAFNDRYHEPYIVPVETAISLALIAYATFASAKRLAAYRDRITREHGNKERVSLDWLGRGWHAILVLAALWIGLDFLQVVFGRFSYATTFYFYAVVSFVFLAMSFDVLSKVDRIYLKMGAADETSEPASPNSFDVQAIRQRVMESGWYLDPDLTLGDLARRLGTNKSTLSALLNSGEAGNFSTFINGLRIEDFCRRAKNHNGSFNLLSLALQSGFGSKATFNRAFKQHKGMSPREWLG